MKQLGILILAVGVAISAAYGARLSPTMHEQLTARGRAQFLQQDEQAAFTAYCAEREEAGRPIADGCAYGETQTEDGLASVEERIAQACAGRQQESREEGIIVGSERERLPELRAAEADLPSELAELRAAWLDALEARIEPAAAAAVLRPIPPEARVGEWFADSGLFFLLGLALVVLGAVLGRVAVKREASEEGPSDGKGQAKDLGHLLDGLREEIGQLAAQMEASDTERPPAKELARIKEAIEELQLTKFEPIVDSAPRVQVKYGMGAFAEIFGPFSSAERSVNRAWSALVDAHFPEARDSMKSAADSLTEAHAVLDRVVQEAAKGAPS